MFYVYKDTGYQGVTNSWTVSFSALRSFFESNFIGQQIGARNLPIALHLPWEQPNSLRAGIRARQGRGVIVNESCRFLGSRVKPLGFWTFKFCWRGFSSPWSFLIWKLKNSQFFFLKCRFLLKGSHPVLVCSRWVKENITVNRKMKRFFLSKVIPTKNGESTWIHCNYYHPRLEPGTVTPSPNRWLGISRAESWTAKPFLRFLLGHRRPVPTPGAQVLVGRWMVGNMPISPTTKTTFLL